MIVPIPRKMSDKGRDPVRGGPERERTVIITGASRGVGRSAALSLVRDHACTVIAVARNEAALGALEQEAAGAAGTLETVGLDLGRDDAAERLLAAVGGRRVHALVHNAGALLRTDMGTYRMDLLMDLYRTNVLAPLLITQALAPLLAGDPPGHVVHIGSMGGFQDSAKFAGLAGYSSSKAALACLAQCLAEEFKDLGIRSNCLALGAVDTEMLRAAFPGYEAPVSAPAMGTHVAWFALEGHKLYNAKVLPVAVGTP